MMPKVPIYIAVNDTECDRHCSFLSDNTCYLFRSLLDEVALGEGESWNPDPAYQRCFECLNIGNGD